MRRWDHNHAFWVQYQPLQTFIWKKSFFPLDSYYTFLPRYPGRKPVSLFLSLLLLFSQRYMEITQHIQKLPRTALNVITSIIFHIFLNQPWCNAGMIKWSLACASEGHINLPCQSYNKRKLVWMQGVYFPGNISALKLSQKESQILENKTGNWILTSFAPPESLCGWCPFQP